MNNVYLDIASVIDSIGTPRFSETLYRACQAFIDFDNACLLAFDSAKRQPLCLAIRSVNKDFEVAVRLYASKYFEQCEVIEKLESMRGTSNISLTRTGVDDIIDPQYRKELFENPRIAYDMMLLETLGTMQFTIELFRLETDGVEGFSEEDERNLREIWPFVLACVQKHVKISKITSSTGKHPNSQIGPLTDMFIGKGVSPREAEVCGHIVLGYSTLAISLRLEISINTVATLRQRAYKKLGLSCMNELHAMCLQSYGNIIQEGDIQSSDFYEDLDLTTQL